MNSSSNVSNPGNNVNVHIMDFDPALLHDFVVFALFILFVDHMPIYHCIFMTTLLPDVFKSDCLFRIKSYLTATASFLPLLYMTAPAYRDNA